jgi:hypothetical protein
MNALRIVAGILGFGSYLLGCLLSSNSPERDFGRILVQGGAIIIAALLISLAISETHRRG